MINNFMQINISGGFFIAIPNKTTQIQNAGECVSFNMKRNKKTIYYYYTTIIHITSTNLRARTTIS